jgi:hypothetical protein
LSFCYSHFLLKKRTAAGPNHLHGYQKIVVDLMCDQKRESRCAAGQILLCVWWKIMVSGLTSSSTVIVSIVCSHSVLTSEQGKITSIFQTIVSDPHLTLHADLKPALKANDDPDKR